jgi:hypothetical protein
MKSLRVDVSTCLGLAKAQNGLTRGTEEAARGHSTGGASGLGSGSRWSASDGHTRHQG